MPADSKVEPYRPSNGSEGMWFEDKWCNRCAREAKFREDQCAENACSIVQAAFMYDEDDPEYPKEWITDEEGNPRCTAFDPENGAHCWKGGPEIEGCGSSCMKPLNHLGPCEFVSNNQIRITFK